MSVMSSEGKKFLHMSSNNGLSMASKEDDISMPVTVKFFFVLYTVTMFKR